MPDAKPTLATIAADTVRVLTFRTPSPAIGQHWQHYLAFGLFFTWLAGIGRYWDNPRADIWQSLGLGSIAYVFFLALILWLVLLPLRPKFWSYRNVLIFITLTSPPALLYAIPVERFVSLWAAQSLNAGFLAIVATWRVALLVWFLRRLAGLSGDTVIVAALLPLALIVVALTALNLEHVVFEFMAGIAPEQRSANDLSYSVVTTLAFLSITAAPVLLASYAWLVYRAQKAAAAN
jgi:hypothetical protein